MGDDTVAASGYYVLLLRCHATQSGEGFAFLSFPLLPGSCPDDPQDHETKALFSCAQEWLVTSPLCRWSNSEQYTQIMQETPQGWVPHSPIALSSCWSWWTAGRPALLVGFPAAHIQQSKAEPTNGRPRFLPEATYNRKAPLFQPDMKSGFFPQLTWLIEGETGLCRSEVWQAREAGNPEENESVKQWLLPAFATSSASVGEGSDSWHLGPARVQEFGNLCLVYMQNTCMYVHSAWHWGSWKWGERVRRILICSWKNPGMKPVP